MGTKTANDGLQVNSPFCEVTSNTLLDNGLGFYSTEELLTECKGNLIGCEFVEDECPEQFDANDPSAVPCFNGDVSGDGIDIGEGSHNSVVYNNVIKNFGDDGLSCRGNYNIIKGNDVSIDDFNPRTSKSEDGITARGFGNQIIDNMIQNTNKDGIDIKFNEDDADCDQEFTGGFNIIRSNTVKAPADGKGIKIGSNNNFIVSNTATDNKEEGFVLSVEEVSGEVRGLANILAGNNASGNGDGPDFNEKGDDAVDCTQNAYIGNN